MSYPNDWLCTNCKKPFEQHVQIGAPGEEGKGQFPAESNWCFASSTPEGKIPKTYNLKFKPMDNLSLIETLAKQKKLK